VQSLQAITVPFLMFLACPFKIFFVMFSLSGCWICFLPT
jgi:hypothetical protein